MTPAAVALRAFLYSILLLVLAAPSCTTTSASSSRWIGTWATSPVAESAEKDKTPFAGATLRQVVHVSIGGSQVRVRLSNAFGAGPLSLHGAHVALAGKDGSIDPTSDRPLRFSGQPAVTIPAGALIVSDPIDFPLASLSDVAITLHFKEVPATLTMHGGSRTTSYLKAGDALSAPAMPDATTFTRWYFINGIDVVARQPSAAVVILGDSITDGYGSPPDQNVRWPDALARRLQARPETRHIAVLNHGIGGNRLLRDGLGPNALARFDRDVLAQAGVRFLIVFEGINDIGTAKDARARGEAHATAADIIAAYEQLIARARTHGLQVIGATITPYTGADFYFSPEGEADRQAVNTWIRSSGRFDAVIDFDAALRNPAEPNRLSPAFDSGDHLHPSIDGYRALADAVDLDLFAK